MGDFARSSDSYANVQRRVNARFKDMGEEIGSKLLPALSNLGLAFLDSTKDGGVLLELFKAMTSTISDVINGWAKLIAIVNQKKLQSDFEEANKAGKNYLELTKQIQAEIIKRYGTMENAVELAKKETAEGREAYRLVELREKGMAKIQKSIDKQQEATEGLTSNTEVLEKIENRIAGVTEKVNNRLDNRLDLTKKIKKVTKETKDEEEKAVLISDNWVASIASLVQGWDKLGSTFEKVQAVNVAVQSTGAAIIDIMNSINQLQQAQTDRRLSQLDTQMEAELEAAGVAEETTVEQAQREYDIALESGSDLEKEEKRRALEKAKIEEKYAKERSRIQYEGDVQAWEMQKRLAIAQGALAAINAYSSAAAIPVIGFTIAPAAAAAALVASAIQYKAIEAAKPVAPKFASGGIIPGSMQGTTITAGENNRTEAILNPDQMANTLMAIANGGGAGEGGGGNITVYLGDDLIYNSMYKASKRGDLIIDTRAVVNR